MSYGMYLWHFPLFTFINHARTGLTGWPLFAVRLVPTLAVAWWSFFYIERPIRQGTFFTSLRVRILTPLAVAVVVVAIILATMRRPRRSPRSRDRPPGRPGHSGQNGHSGGVPEHPGPGPPGG